MTTTTQAILDVVTCLVADTEPVDNLALASTLLDIARTAHAAEAEAAVTVDDSGYRTLDQNRAMFGAWSELEASLGHARDDDEQAARHLFATVVLGRPVDSWAFLTQREADVLIDRMNLLIETTAV